MPWRENLGTADLDPSLARVHHDSQSAQACLVAEACARP